MSRTVVKEGVKPEMLSFGEGTYSTPSRTRVTLPPGESLGEGREGVGSGQVGSGVYLLPLIFGRGDGDGKRKTQGPFPTLDSEIRGRGTPETGQDDQVNHRNVLLWSGVPSQVDFGFLSSRILSG